MGADEVRIEVIAPHAKGQPSLTLWLGKRNGRMRKSGNGAEKREIGKPLRTWRTLREAKEHRISSRNGRKARKGLEGSIPNLFVASLATFA